MSGGALGAGLGALGGPGGSVLWLQLCTQAPLVVLEEGCCEDALALR